MNELPNLEGEWARLAEETGNLPSVELESLQLPSGSIRIALTGEGHRILLIPVPKTTLVDTDLGTGEIEVTNEHFPIDGELRFFVQILCLNPDLQEVFASLLNSVVRRLQEGEPVASAIACAVEEFKQLLRQPSQISLEKLIGALGELKVLDELLDHNPAALSSWKGPSGHRHDFVSGVNGLEVKTGLRAQEDVVEIHALDQLEPLEGGMLDLHHLVLEEAAGAGLEHLSLKKLTEKIRARGVPADLFQDCLNRLGISDLLPGEQEREFRLLRQCCYRVEEKFPRLRPRVTDPGHLPEGVSHLRYRVNLASARSFLCTDQDRIDRMKAFTEGLQ